MEHFSRLLKMLLRDSLTAPGGKLSPAATLLREVCCTRDGETVERAVVAGVLEAAGYTDTTGTGVDVAGTVALPSEQLEVLVAATKVAAIRFLQHAVAEVMAPGLDLLWDGKPVYEAGKLYMAGRLLGTWRNQPANNCPQIAVLQAFQANQWPKWIPTPFACEERAVNTCKNMNRKLGGTIRFLPSFDRIDWTRDGGNDTRTTL